MKLDLLDIDSDDLINQNHHATSIGFANMFQGEISHDQMSRHLRLEDYSSSNLGLYVKADSKKTYTDELDTTCRG